jgi:hypothetical protein
VPAGCGKQVTCVAFAFLQYTRFAWSLSIIAIVIVVIVSISSPACA